MGKCAVCAGRERYFIKHGFIAGGGTLTLARNADRVALLITGLGQVNGLTNVQQFNGVTVSDISSATANCLATQTLASPMLLRIEDLGQLLTGDLFISGDAIGSAFAVTEIILRPETSTQAADPVPQRGITHAR